MRATVRATGRVPDLVTLPAARLAFVSPVLVSLRRWYVGTAASLALPVTVLELDLRGKDAEVSRA
jgi:hypothetical protein